MELKDGQKLRVKEFDEIPSHWIVKMKEFENKIVTFKERTNYIKIFEDNNYYGGFDWKESDFQIVFDTWKDVYNMMKDECVKYNNCCYIICNGCELKKYTNNNFCCYTEPFINKDYKKLAENFEKMFGMECYVLEDERMNKEFELSNLENEMVLVNRKGTKYVVIGDNFIGKDRFDSKDNYRKNMKNITFYELDIVEVYNPSRKYGNGLFGLLELVGEPIWKEKTTTKDVSLEEINALLKEKYPDVEKFNLPIDKDK